MRSSLCHHLATFVAPVPLLVPVGNHVAAFQDLLPDGRGALHDGAPYHSILALKHEGTAVRKGAILPDEVPMCEEVVHVVAAPHVLEGVL